MFGYLDLLLKVLAQHALEHLPGGVARQIPDKVQLLRLLEAGQTSATVCLQYREIESAADLENHNRNRRSPHCESARPITATSLTCGSS